MPYQNEDQKPINDNLPAKSDESTNLPVTPDEEVTNIYKASERVPFLKFKKGDFLSGPGDGEEIPVGTEVWCYCGDWRRGWRKWADDQIVTDLMVRVAETPAAPLERRELGDLDESKWATGNDGQPKDPWSLENQLPVESVETGERFLFTTSSFGGKIAIEAICNKWATARRRKLDKGLPRAKLEVTEFNTKAYGKVKRPDFVLTGWEREPDGDPIDVTPLSPTEQKKKDFHDEEIPF